MLKVLRQLHRNQTEKAMAPHSSTLAWKIPWMEEPGKLQSMGSLRREGGRAEPLKELPSLGTGHKLIRTKWVQNGRSVDFH